MERGQSAVDGSYFIVVKIKIEKKKGEFTAK
jgi:hypothetical protein